jgi:phospholipid transport system transporter-binding protein
VTGLAADGDGGRFRLTGPAGFRQAAALLAAGERLFDTAPAVTVDLAGVTAVDSATLALLLEWQRQGRHRGRPVAFTGMPERLAALAQLSGVAGLLAGASPGAPAGR